MTLDLTPMARQDEYNRFQKFKVLKHSGKIEEIVRGQIPAPVEWVIYPSNICGYRCGHCIMAREQEDHRGMLSKEAMLRIPEDARKNGIKVVIFSGGGDPMLNPHILESAKRLRAYGIKTGINNQGYLLDDPAAFDFVRYSVDAATPDTYQAIHRVPRGDGWERVNASIKKLAEARAAGATAEMGLAFLITPLNFHETYAFCEWGAQYNPDFFHIRPAYLDANYLDEKYPGGGVKIKDEIIPNLREMSAKVHKDFPNAYFRVDKFEGFWSPKKYNKCRANTLIAVTSGDGAFLVCQDRGIMSDENFLRWGDYNKHDFATNWWSAEHRQVMNSINLDRCPRCVENGYNEIIEAGFVDGDAMKLDLL